MSSKAAKQCSNEPVCMISAIRTNIHIYVREKDFVVCFSYGVKY